MQRVNKGLVHGGMKPGAELKLTALVGKEMLMAKDPDANIMMLATGTEIARFRSFLQMMFFEKHDDCKEFERMKEKAPNNFRVDFAVSREQTNEKGEKNVHTDSYWHGIEYRRNLKSAEQWNVEVY